MKYGIEVGQIYVAADGSKSGHIVVDTTTHEDIYEVVTTPFDRFSKKSPEKIDAFKLAMVRYKLVAERPDWFPGDTPEERKVIELGEEISGTTIGVGYYGTWTPSRQQVAIHQNAKFVGVSQEQFYAVAKTLDAISTPKHASQTNGSGDCSIITLRNGILVGRVYTDHSTHRIAYFMDRDFAQKSIDTLKSLTIDSPAEQARRRSEIG